MNSDKRITDSEERASDIFKPESERLSALVGSSVLIKMGGNAMVDKEVSSIIFDQVATLTKLGLYPVIVHGGGPVIKKLLDDAGIQSEFIEGHRKTDEKAMRFVEMALSGSVNGEIVKQLNFRGVHAVGLTGKDASMVTARKRVHRSDLEEEQEIDLGYVGDVDSVDSRLVSDLIGLGYLPVVAPVAAGKDRMDYNINADLFAGHLAGSLNVTAFIAITDVDGLMENPDDPATRLESVSSEKIRELMGEVVQGGMIPKAESCLIALEAGVQSAHIINGTRPDTLLNLLLTNKSVGTTVE